MNEKGISLIQFIRQWIFLKKKSIQLTLAIKLCDLKQQAFNRRYFVILDYNDKLISLSKEDVNRMKKRRLIDKGITHLDLMEKSFYYTPLSRNDNTRISREEQKKRKENYIKFVKVRNKIGV